MDKGKQTHRTLWLRCAVSWISAAVSILVLSFCVGSTSLADKEDLEASIKEKENAITQAQDEKKQLQAGVSDIKAMVADLENTKGDLEKYVQQLDANLEKIQKKIDEMKQLIADKETEIKETEEMLQEAIKTEEEQYVSMKVRIRYMYERGNTTNYLEILFSSKTFGELLNNADYIQQVTDYDHKMLEEYKQNRKLIETCKTALEEEKEVLTEAKASVEKEEKGLESLISAKEQQITAYEGDISNKEEAIKAYEAEIAAQNSTIAALEAAVANEKKLLEEQNKATVTYDGGMFQFPAPSYKRVSDDYGNRMHPTLGVQKFHNGIDLAAPSGSPILAAYDGTVVGAAYNSSMGNYVMINHGDGLYTIYMHASALYVSNGQTVTKGQQIAAVGSTGRSTGPHLHFSVRLNGNYVNPWNYLR